MPRKDLTTRFVETVKVDTRTDFQDNMIRGLWLRVSPSGVRTWSLVYTRESDGMRQRVKLGRFPDMPLEKARQAALKGMTAIVDGADPAGDKRTMRKAMTVAELGEIFVEEYAKPNKRTWAEDERILKKEVNPEIGRLKAAAVKRRDILDIIDAKAKAGKPVQSNNILATVRKMFGWAVDQDYLPISPVTGIKPRGKSVKRDRVLTDAEIKRIWPAISAAPISAEVADILRLLFFTGQRSGEVCGMRRGEIDVDKWTWTIPGERSKNGLAHVVPLPIPARGIVQSALERAEDEKDSPLFSRVGTPIESNAVAKAVRLNFQTFDEKWTAHDIRRTVATGMADIGVSPHIVEACLNHISGFRSGVAGVYNRSKYEPEKRRAFDMWAERLLSIVEDRDSVIVPLVAERG